MNRTSFIGGLLLCLLSLPLLAQSPLWLRYPAISPDGRAIVFSYRGDLYRVPSTGGSALPLTLHEGHDFMPVWSHDGRWIAFASERYGNYDVFVMPAEGGTATRLTFHSANDYPSDFSPDDSRVLFTSARLDAASNQQFPSGVLPELYAVPVQGGRVSQVLTTPAESARYSPDGQLLIFHDRKGYEDPFRKHHTSSVTRDIWSYHLPSGKYTQLTSFAGEDRNPIVSPDGQWFYYLSEANGSFNVFKKPLNGPGEPQPLTHLHTHPVRHLSMSKDGLMCFSYDGELYTLREGEQPRKVEVHIAADARYNPEKIVSVTKDATELAVSPNGKEVAFVFRGEVFAASIKEGTTRRITNTPEQERSISFSPDGRSILYATERGESWDVYRTSLAREEEKYFFNATLLNEEPVIATPAEEFQPAWSPDGKEVAYLEERTTLKVVNLETGAVRQILSGDKNYSYTDGDQHYQWSPDGKWFLVNFIQPNQWIDEVGLVAADGRSEVINLTQSGYNDLRPQWALDGKMMLWASDRDGMKNDASWGGQLDVYAMFFTQDAYDRFKLSKEEYELMKEAEKEEKDDDEKKDQPDEKKEKTTPEPLTLELEGLEDRKARLTIHSSTLGGFQLSKEGDKLFYLAKFEKGYDLWQTDLKSKETKILTKLNAKNVRDFRPDKEGKNLFVLADGNIFKIDPKEGKKEKVNFKGEMILNEAAERAYLFEHIWRQVKKKFYKTDLHQVDWDAYKTAYRRFLPHIDNSADFAEMASEMLGELNASHTGARYRPQRDNPDQTASLGLFYDQNWTGTGLKIEEVMLKSPVIQKGSKIRPGVVIEKIDGVEITPSTNHFRLLNRKAGKNTLLGLYDPDSGERWEEVVKPITLNEERELLYQRWVRRCRAIVEELSDGKIGYVHVRGMNDRSYRTVYEEVLGKNAQKKALIVDTRFNGGGWLHDDLATFLSGKDYITFMPRGQNLGNEPQFKWSKPSIVVMSESNYSDAHMFPYTYKTLGIGKLVGMPVPGTGTAVWWERLQNGIVFGIPQVGMVDVNGEYLENNQLEPDIRVPNEPGLVSQGRDQQLEAAVRELLKVVVP